MASAASAASVAQLSQGEIAAKAVGTGSDQAKPRTVITISGVTILFDRLFGEPDPVFIDGVAGSPTEAPLPPIGTDALVTLSDLSDALLLPAADEATGTAHDIAAIYDFGADSHAVVHLHDGWSWEQSAAEWSYDHHG